MQYYVEIVAKATEHLQEHVVETLGPMPYDAAERIESAANIPMNREYRYARMVSEAEYRAQHPHKFM